MSEVKKSFGYADELFGFPRFDDNVREVSRFPIRSEESKFVPEKDPGYVFRKEYLHVLQLFAFGKQKNILLQGDTGTGKTSLIEQFAARLNWPVFSMGCHGGVEFQEFIGRVTLQPDGSTGWADGPLISAMRVGGIMLLDEMNFLKPEVAGGLNTALQAKTLVIPETGELVSAHPDFRIAATGNAIDGAGKGAYRGTQTSNIALLSRFTLGIRVKYMSTQDETAMIKAKAPFIHPTVANYLAELADMSRKSYAEGALRSPMSPRETIAASNCLAAYSGNMTGENALKLQCESVEKAFEMTFLFRWPAEDRTEFVTASKKVADRLGIAVVLS